MKKYTLSLFLLLASYTWGEPVELGDISYFPVSLPCPDGDLCDRIDESFCSPENIETSTNNDNTFDLVFNDYFVMTNDNSNYMSGSCIFQMPINIDSTQQVSLKEVSVGGITVVFEGNQTTAGITHFFGLRESTRIEAFSATQAFTLTHAQDLNDEYSQCGNDNVVISTRIDVTARKELGETNNPFINLSSGAGRIQYTLDYKDCEPNPSHCASDEFEFNNVCYSHADFCENYTSTGLAEVCKNTEDTLQCNWDVDDFACVDECTDNQISSEGNCYNFSNTCSGYDFTSAAVCSSNADLLECAWEESTQRCTSECGLNGTFELDGQCYEEAGSCSQYNGTNTNTCNNDFDVIGCEWIPNTHSDVTRQNTCASSCPSGTFAIDGSCYEVGGSCSQFNQTNSDLCNTGEDEVGCDWIPGSHSTLSLANTCASSCPDGTFKIDGVCYEEGGSCSQFNGTNDDTCNTTNDNVSCDWNASSNVCYSPEQNICSDSDSFEINGVCYLRDGFCSQYNGTDDSTCNTGLDSLYCDWNSSTDTCTEE